MVHLFIALSKNQLYNCETIIKQEKLTKETTVLLSSKAFDVDKTLFGELYLLDADFSNQSNGILNELSNITKKIKNYKKLIQAVSKYKNTKDCLLYFSYIEDVLTNHMLFYFNKNIKGIVVEDGVLNYYNHTIKNLSLKKVFLKKLLSDLLGVRFKFYKGHSSGIAYNQVIKQYVRKPDLCVFPEKAVKLEVPKHQIKKLSNSVLIIGQEPLEKVIGTAAYYLQLNQVFDAALEHALKNNIKTLYYKPHRHGKRVDKSFFTKFNKEVKLKIIDSNNAIETLFFEKEASKYIFAFNTSAVLNIKIGMEDTIKNTVNFTVFLSKNDTLYDLYKSLGFNIVIF